MTTESAAERRGSADRRVTRVSLRFPERRSGFDRRRPEGGPVRLAYWRVLEGYRRRPSAIAAVIYGFVVLSVADLVLTVAALEAGAAEVNPVMAALFEVGPVAAGTVKIGLALGVAAVMWAARRYRRILEVSLLGAALMSALLAYHFAVAIRLAG